MFAQNDYYTRIANFKLTMFKYDFLDEKNTKVGWFLN